jgi:hypothetical protein
MNDNGTISICSGLGKRIPGYERTSELFPVLCFLNRMSEECYFV